MAEMARTAQEKEAAMAEARKQVRFDEEALKMMGPPMGKRRETAGRRQSLEVSRLAEQEATATLQLEEDEAEDEGFTHANFIQKISNQRQKWHLDKPADHEEDFRQKLGDLASSYGGRSNAEGPAAPFRALTDAAKTAFAGYTGLMDDKKYLELQATNAEAMFHEHKLLILMAAASKAQTDEQAELIKKMNDNVDLIHTWADQMGQRSNYLEEELSRARDELEAIRQGGGTRGTSPSSQDVDGLLQQISERDQRIADLQETVADMAILASRNSRAGTPAGDTVHSVSGSVVRERWSAKVADPPVFCAEKDKDTVNFEAWIRQIRNKLDVNKDHFDSDKAKRVYVESRIGGVAANNLQPYLREDNPNKLATLSELLEHLESEYDNPNKKEEARQEFLDLRMDPRGDYAKFKNDFVRLAGETRLAKTEWKAEFKRKLTVLMQNNLVTAYLDSTVDFERFARMGAEINNNLRLQQQAAAKNKGDKNIGTADKAPRGGNGRGGFQAKGGGTKPAGPRLSADELKKLMAEGRCFTCREVGHTTANCPKKEAGRGRNDNARLNNILERYGNEEVQASLRERLNDGDDPSKN